MTRQEMFDKAALHLLKQGAKSSDAAGSCYYRAPSGFQCAVGCLIPDELYRPRMEGLGVHSVVTDEPLLHDHIPDLYLASELQSIHDEAKPEDWKCELIALARDAGLSAAAIESFGQPA